MIWTSQEKENHKSEYGCEILIENGTLEQVSTTNAPTDACIVTYEYKIRFVVTLQEVQESNCLICTMISLKQV